ncbi:RNA methyltransferase TrmH, group 3 [Candidatus Magnetoovum chiemensis]|nr:RNA methyltransferase TrmH, group 3 [Candidatus Magnetoovum chiemensis]
MILPDTWIYGINPVKEALESSKRIKKIVVLDNKQNPRINELIKIAKDKSVPLERADRNTFKRFDEYVHQGVCALTYSRNFQTLDSIYSQAGMPSLFVILDGIEDPRNFGAIIRTAEAAGSDGVIFQSHHFSDFTPIVEKASSGAYEFVPLCMVSNIKHAIKFLKDKGVLIIGTHIAAKQELWHTDLEQPIAFVFGSEGKGIKRTVAEKCDYLVNLPLYGKVSSLNVSVAAGVFLFECKRQRNILNKKNAY